MKRGLILVLLIAIFAINFSVAEIVSDSLHLNIQVTNSSGIATGTFNFGFNISNTNGCNTGNIIYADAISLATDDRGIISHYLDNVNLNFSEQYWLCYYRNNVLISTSKIARTPYSFKAKNTTTSGIIADADLSLGSYGLTTNNGWLNGGVSILDGDIYAQSLFVYNISSINVNNININGSLYPPISASFDIGSSTLRWKDLYLSGTATAGSLLHLSSGSPVEVWLDQTGGGNTNRKISSSGSSMIFYSDATEQARFDAAGDFGIGTNGEPYHPLTLLR
ncbi:MAG: hypothetical protein M1416_03015, partial [Candidatus Pacearchaeota archaeon]|nr:hypothetical protein [Candidatus Pacearchaeota archaeon]